MTELSKKQTYQKVLINISTYISFVMAYIVYGFGLFPARGVFFAAINFLILGLFFYVIFEVVISLFFNIYYKYIPDFAFSQKDYKLYLRLLFIFRNIAISLINIIFIFFPVASIWGLKLTHIITTIVTVSVGLYLIRAHLQAQKYRYLVLTGLLTLVYLLIYLFLGVIA